MSVARGRPVQITWPACTDGLVAGGLARDMMAAQVPGPPGRRHETAEQREARLSARRRVFIVRAHGTRVRIHATARDGSPRNTKHSPSTQPQRSLAWDYKLKQKVLCFRDK